MIHSIPQSSIIETSRESHFSCTYKTGIHSVPRFDGHLAVYGEHKNVTIQYNTPYIKHLPIKVKVNELVEGEAVTKEILTTFEDAYTAEIQDMHPSLTKGKEIKTSVENALNDLRLLEMMLEEYERSLVLKVRRRVNGRK